MPWGGQGAAGGGRSFRRRALGAKGQAGPSLAKGRGKVCESHRWKHRRGGRSQSPGGGRGAESRPGPAGGQGPPDPHGGFPGVPVVEGGLGGVTQGIGGSGWGGRREPGGGHIGRGRAGNSPGFRTPQRAEGHLLEGVVAAEGRALREEPRLLRTPRHPARTRAFGTDATIAPLLQRGKPDSGS